MEYLPKFLVIKPYSFSQYVYYERGTDYGQIFCLGQSAFNAYSKIEVEPSKTSEKYCHLRFCQSNRYWSRCAEDEGAVAAVSKQPEEDTSKPSCTLFEPRIVEGDRLILTHVKSGQGVQTNEDSKHRLWLWPRNPEWEKGWETRESKLHLFTYLNWDQLVYIPKHVVFRGTNNGFLKSVNQAGHNYLQFSSIDANDGKSAHEVILQWDGHVRIKSIPYDGRRYRGKFWRRDNSDWICADSTDESGNDVNTLFWPVKVDDRTIALRSVGNKLFVKRLTSGDKNDCLCAFAASENSEEARMVVEELVLESNIFNVKFRMEDARVISEEPYVAYYAEENNVTDKVATVVRHVQVQHTASSTFTRMTSLKIGAKTTFTTGIPFIEEGKIKVSCEVAETLQWGSAREEKKRQEPMVVAVVVPPKSRVRANYVATKGKYSIPFSYTEKYRSSMDGKYVYTRRTDGICYGVDYYSFRFEHLEHPSIS